MLLRKSHKSALNPYEALLDQRNTPAVEMTTSPTQRFLNRRTRTEIPMKGALLTPKIAEKVLEEKANTTKKSQFYLINRPSPWRPPVSKMDTVFPESKLA